MRGCFLVRVIGFAKLEAALLDHGFATCDLEENEMQQIVGSIIAKIAADGCGYRYSSVGTAKVLQVTVEEVRAAGLVRLHPVDPQLQAERRAERLRQDRERKIAQRPSASSRRANAQDAGSPGRPSASRGRPSAGSIMSSNNGDETSNSITTGGGGLGVLEASI